MGVCVESLKIVIPAYGFIKSGGFRVLTKLANGLAARGHSVTFVVPQGAGQPYYPIDPTVNIEVVDRSGKPLFSVGQIGTGRLSGRQATLALYQYLRNNVRREHRVIANYNLTAFPVYLCGKGRGYYYIQAYEPEFYDEQPESLKKYLRKFMAWSSYFLPLKKIVNAQIYKCYKNIRSNDVSYPGLDLQEYYPKQLSVEKKSELVLGFIGRTESWKGGDLVASSVNRLRNDGVKVKLKVAFNRIQDVEQEFCQPRNDAELADFYRSLDLMLAPGTIQMGAVHYPVIEAMACNVPVVTTGYYPANMNNSFLVNPASVEDIVNIVQSVAIDYRDAARRAKVALKDVRQFEWSRVLDHFEDILKSES